MDPVVTPDLVAKMNEYRSAQLGHHHADAKMQKSANYQKALAKAAQEKLAGVHLHKTLAQRDQIAAALIKPINWM